jgi:nitroreductase
LSIFHSGAGAKMDLFDALKNRWSIRKYTRNQIPEGSLRILEAASQDPSAGSLHP